MQKLKRIVRVAQYTPSEDERDFSARYTEEPIVDYATYALGVGVKTTAGLAADRYLRILQEHPTIQSSRGVADTVHSIHTMLAHKVFAGLLWLQDPANRGTWATRSLRLLSDCYRYAAYQYYHDTDNPECSLLTDEVFDRLQRFCVVNRRHLRDAEIIPTYIADEELNLATAMNVRVLQGIDRRIYNEVLTLVKATPKTSPTSTKKVRVLKKLVKPK